MVRYYGRARQRTGAVNRNQPGLKRAGCITGAGRPTWVGRYIRNRVNCNARVGCVDANGNKTRRHSKSSRRNYNGVILIPPWILKIESLYYNKQISYDYYE